MVYLDQQVELVEAAPPQALAVVVHPEVEIVDRRPRTPGAAQAVATRRSIVVAVAERLVVGLLPPATKKKLEKRTAGQGEELPFWVVAGPLPEEG